MAEAPAKCEISVLRCEFEQASCTLVLVVLQDPDRTVRPLDDGANPRTHLVTLDVAGIEAVELDTHDRVGREPGRECIAVPVLCQNSALLK